jgi:hypothetical protein
VIPSNVMMEVGEKWVRLYLVSEFSESQRGVDDFVDEFGRIATEELGVPVRGFFGRCDGVSRPGGGTGWLMVIRFLDDIDEKVIRELVCCRFGNQWNSVVCELRTSFPSLHIWEQVSNGSGVIVGLKPGFC